MDKFLTKYAEIMNVYRNGGFGPDHLTFYEIMSKAGDADFLDKMTLSEIQSLISSSSGMTKQFFLKKREKKQIALEKMQKLEEELHDLNIQQYCGGGDVSDVDIAKNLKLKVSYCSASELPEDVEATLSPTDDMDFFGIIMVLKASAANFSYMHEIIHYLRDVGVGNKVSRSFTRKKQGKTDSMEEQDINYLTAAAIMPFDQIAKELNAYESTNFDDEPAFFSPMVVRYKQEEDAILRRFIEVRSLVDFRNNYC